jgi:uncharacterized iron-regulated protein
MALRKLHAALLLAAMSPLPAAATEPPPGLCLPAGAWTGTDGQDVAPADAIARLAQARVILLGETHATPEHHRWQAEVIAALAADGRPVIIALEMLPRDMQPALDRWISGATDEAMFLAESDWKQNWGHDFAAYRPLFALARERGIPMRAINIDRGFVRSISREGFEAAVAAHGQVTGRPAPAPESYVQMLRGAFAMHGKPPSEEALARFVEAQASWDRGMAEGIVTALDGQPEARVVGIMGYGHVVGGWGVAHQLEALGHAGATSAIPVRATPPCNLRPGAADFLAGAG